jgi:chromosome segregation ATPase
MEQLTEQEAININNYKAQLSNVLSNLSDANNELGDLLMKKAQAEKEYVSLKATNNALSIENAVVSKRIHAVEELIDQAQDALESKKHELDKLSLDKESELVLVNTEINKRNEEIASLEKTRHTLENEIDSLKDKIDKEESRLSKVKAFIEDAEMVSRSRVAELSWEIEDIAGAKMKAEIELSEELSKLEEIQKKNAEEHNKYLEPIKHLAIEEEKLNRKREQIQILYNRAKAVFEKLYPGQNIDNLIR